MNHLAHALLSAPEPGHRLGNLFGDAVRGPLRGQDLPSSVLAGVRAHRHIDAITDRHAATIQLRERFPAPLRRYAGIILDVAFDHYLTRRWQRFCDTGRRAFTLEIYDIMQQNPALLPSPVRPLAPRMIAGDFLSRCESLDGVMAVLSHIDGRLSRGFDLALTRRTLEEHDAALEHGFTRVFTDVHFAISPVGVRSGT